jgi:hypothetical protein
MTLSERDGILRDWAMPHSPVHLTLRSICRCGWDILYCPNAQIPAWFHQLSGEKECGTDDLRTPGT